MPRGEKSKYTDKQERKADHIAEGYEKRGVEEHEDAEETKRLVEAAGRKAVLIPGDIQEAAHCRKIIEKAVAELGGIDILVNNAAHQASFKDIADISRMIV